uniref:HAT C-terminal dimerisation domain-containing protein n=1 Tax=Lactuca sativa TaxID=4236 RepID=A0A9R1UTR7_LACSA|nr:hypothetical protein LSAT_V11C800398450 [Lactuca sativa]
MYKDSDYASNITDEQFSQLDVLKWWEDREQLGQYKVLASMARDVLTRSNNKGLLLLRRSSTSTVTSFKMVLCFRGNVAVVRTSWTSRNPGRRFYA